MRNRLGKLHLRQLTLAVGALVSGESQRLAADGKRPDDASAWSPGTRSVPIPIDRRRRALRVS